MAGERQIKVTILGDSAGAQKALGVVQREAGETESKFAKMGTTLARVVGTGALLTFGNNAKNMASDVAEAGSKVGVVFGESRAQVDAFAASSTKSFGISKRAALEATGTFGNLFTATGLAKDAAAGMSVDVVKLAADLGSFNNLGTDEVLEKLRAGLVGEVEPLRTLGVNMNAAMVEAKAMEMGLADANGEISEGAKVQARYALILEATKNAQGDFARTADGMANSGKVAAAQAEDTSAKFGDVLAPAMAKANAMLSAGLELFNSLPGPVQQGTIAVGLLTTGITLLAGRTAAWTAVTKVGAAAMWLLNAALAANPIVLVTLAIAALAAAVVIAYQRSETFRNVVDSLGRAFIWLKDAALDAISLLVDKWLGAVEWIVRGAAQAFGWIPGIGPQLREAAGKIEEFRDDANRFLAGIRGEVEISADSSKFWEEYDRVASVARRGIAIETQRQPGDTSSGPQRFAEGLDVGPVRGRPGQAVPIIAHAGEYVVTPRQLAALRRGGGSDGSWSTAGGRVLNIEAGAIIVYALEPRQAALEVRRELLKMAGDMGDPFS